MADKFNEPGRAAETAHSAENGEALISQEKVQETLIELIKEQEEQKKRIDRLTADNNNLRAENRSLRERVDALSRESDDLRRQVNGRVAAAQSANNPVATAETAANNERPLTAAEVFQQMGRHFAEPNESVPVKEPVPDTNRTDGTHFAAGAHFATKEPTRDAARSDGAQHFAVGAHFAAKEPRVDVALVIIMWRASTWRPKRSTKAMSLSI